MALLRCCCACALLVSVTAPAARATAPVDWSIEPYLWATSIDTDLRTRQPPDAASGETGFGGVIDKLDGAFLIRIEARGDQLGAFADFIYLGLGDSKDYTALSTETDLDARLLDTGLAWRMTGPDRERGFDVYAGLRWIDLDLNVRFDPSDPSRAGASVHGSGDYADLLIGTSLRCRWSRWGVALRGDGSLGQTDGSWGVAATLDYRTRHGAWLFGYRHLDASLAAADFSTRIVLSGPHIGYALRF